MTEKIKIKKRVIEETKTEEIVMDKSIIEEAVV